MAEQVQVQRGSGIVVSLISVITGVIETLLVLRFIFRVAGANPSSGFVDFMYAISGPLVAPFAGIFGTPPVARGAVVASVFEWSTIVALIIYGVIGAFLIRLASAGSRTERQI